MNPAIHESVTHALPTPQSLSKLARPVQLKASSSAAYTKALRHFHEVFGGKLPCDRTTVDRYIATQRNKVAPATIYLRVQALRHEHLRLGHPSPTDDPVLRTVMRQLQQGFVPGKLGAAPKRKEPRKAKPMTRAMLTRALDAMGTDALDRRDCCILLLGFGAALSRSALAAIDVADISFTNDVMVVRVREGDEEADQPAARTVTVPITGHELCAATATKAWISHAALDLEGGPLLRRFDRGGDPTPTRLEAPWISVVVKNRLKAVGIDPTPYSALSLRRGRLAEIAKAML